MSFERKQRLFLFLLENVFFEDDNFDMNTFMLHNVIDLTEVLHKMTEKGEPATLELAKHLSPYLNGQIRRFGRYDLDMNDLPAPLQLPKLQFI